MKLSPIGSTGSAELGNTKLCTSSAKRDTAKKAWAFTLNNYTEQEYTDLITFLNSAPDCKYIIGKEVGEKGTPHLQGYIEFGKKQRFSENKAINKRINFSMAISNREDNVKYCSKEGNYVVKGFKVNKPLKLIKENMLYDWQKEIIKIVEKEPDDRTIYWIWSEKGKMGKTQFAKYLSYHYGGIPLDGSKNNVLYVAAEHDVELYTFILSRSQRLNAETYECIEKIKDGYYMNGKYEGKPIIRNPPHIFIFANCEPDFLALSEDRWVVKNVD